MVLIKPLGEDFTLRKTPGTVKPFQVSLVEPVAYPLSYLVSGGMPILPTSPFKLDRFYDKRYRIDRTFLWSHRPVQIGFGIRPVDGNATNISVDHAVGAVQNTGSLGVRPSESTTYTLTATGPGGASSASVPLSVTAAPPPWSFYIF